MARRIAAIGLACACLAAPVGFASAALVVDGPYSCGSGGSITITVSYAGETEWLRTLNGATDYWLTFDMDRDGIADFSTRMAWDADATGAGLVLIPSAKTYTYAELVDGYGYGHGSNFFAVSLVSVETAFESPKSATPPFVSSLGETQGTVMLAPEPATMVLLLVGGLAVLRRRK